MAYIWPRRRAVLDDEPSTDGTFLRMDFGFDASAAWNEAVTKLGGWAEGLIQLLPNLVVALLVLLVFWALAGLVRKAVRSVLDRFTDHRSVKRLVGTLSWIGVLLAGLFVALGVLELDKTLTSLLAGIGILGLALGFAFQDIAENFIAGVLLSLRRPFAEGDIVQTNDFMGVVEHVDLRATVLRTFQGQSVRIPNADVYQNPMVNYSSTGSRRVDVAVGVSYGDDLAEARRVAVDAVEGLEFRDSSRDVELFYEEFGGSSINFKVRFWISFGKQTDYLKARSEAIIRIKEAFDREGVSIPFPIRTLDFSRVGGRLLSEELQAAGGQEPAAAAD